MDIRSINNVVQPTLTPTKGSADTPVVATSTPAESTASAEAVQTSQAVQSPIETHTAEQLSQAIKEINKALQSFSVGLEFSMDEDTQKTIVKVVDKQTQDVIRQIPSPEVLEIAKALDKIQGLLIQQEA